MEPDCYLVEVLHYLNPHLIWVKVLNRSADVPTLEQIGVYGVLPLDVKIDIGADNVVTERCKTWQPAATMVLKKAFMQATEVSFQPTHIDRRSSIFDTNIHKYGEIIIRKGNGKMKMLSSYLKHSGFAVYSEAAFHQELSLGNIYTKLSKHMADEVMKEIKSRLSDNDSEVSLQKQTTVYQAAKKLEELTTENLDRHNRTIKKMISGEDIMSVLNRKFKDLELCKDLEETPMGRAVSRSKLRNEQKLDRVEVKESKAKSNGSSNSLNTININKKYVSVESDNVITNMCQNKRFKDEVDCVSRGITESCSHDVKSGRKGEEPNFERRRNLYKNIKSLKSKVPAYDVLTHKRIAYSPPGVDKTKLVFKIVPIHQETKETPKENREDNQDEILELKDDMFKDVDSDVNIKVTNKDVLENYNNDRERGRSDSTGELEKKMEEKGVTDDSSSESKSTLKSRLLQRKLVVHNEKRRRNDSVSSVSNTTNKDTSSSNDDKERDGSEDDVSKIIEKYKANLVTNIIENKPESNIHLNTKKNNVNPFKNVDPNLSVFVEKLVSPVLMVHTKNDSRIEPKSNLSQIPFNTHVHNVLKNMNVERPMTMQSVSWFSVLRGCSVFLIGPQGSGKTMGYLPSVCRLISDSDNAIVNSVGPTCVIVCATAQSVADVEFKCKMLLGVKEKIFACYAGMDMLKITTSLLNGCDLFICTPCVLAKLTMQTDFGLDLRRLSMFVLDDCERLDVVYKNEIKIGLFKVREMMKTRANKEVKVQFVVASRVWCDFMEPLAKKAPNSVICIGAFQECVLYSKANTTVDFVKTENKNTKVLEFLEKNEKIKKTVIVCREDEEVEILESIVKREKYVVFACNSKMTVEDLRTLNKAWDEYADPVSAPILVCCDGNLSHMNVTDAYYLLHYSMPELFSMFCKRFSVLNDNYPSIFKTENGKVSIKIILEDNNVEQLPKICNFVKRCTKEFPDVLDGICQEILYRKDLVRASQLVPICGSLLALGECPDFWYCKERHNSSKIPDEPEEWMPTNGIITFKILHYQTAVLYSALLLSNIKKDGTKKYPKTYSTLSLKMGMFFSQESNRKLQGIPKIGDICAVAIKQNFFVRCQVVNIINKYRTGNPNHVLIKLIDEEKMETARDIYLYHLPKELRDIKTPVVQVRLAGVVPKDKDVTFSDLAKNNLKNAVDNNDDLYMRGKVVLTVGNTVFVDNIDACQDLSSMNEVVVKNNFKELLEPHSETFPDHIKKLKSSLFPDVIEHTDFEEVEEAKPVKKAPNAQWAHLNREDLSLVYFTSAVDPGTFFVRLTKFQDTMEALGKGIDIYVKKNPEPLTDAKENDIVLAKFPDDECYERARVDSIDGNKVKCFFVDHGDWREVPQKHLIEIPDKFITQMPFQAIECRLFGVQPAGDDWTDFSTNWLSDKCDGEDLKALYVRYFSSEKAKFTCGTKYAVALIDTTGEKDVIYNNLMLDLNLAAPKESEIDILDNTDYMKSAGDGEKNNAETDNDSDWETTVTNNKQERLSNQLIRSMPLVNEDDDESDDDRWSFNMFGDIINTVQNKNLNSDVVPAKLQIKSADLPEISENKGNDSVISEYEVIAPVKIKELDSDDLSSPESQSTKSESLMRKVSEGSRPKIEWRQSASTVTLKIMIIGAGDYVIEIKDRSISFAADVRGTLYKFNIELYGIVDKKKSTHENKGQYIIVKLVKRIRRNWLTLTKGIDVTKLISYDVSSIPISSDEEEVTYKSEKDTLRKLGEKHLKDVSDSEEDFCDDADYSYNNK